MPQTSPDPPSFPKLRLVEATNVQVEGSAMVALRDPAWPPDRAVLLSHGALALVSLFDGHRDRGDLQAELLRRHGELVDRELIDTVIAQVDAALLLHSPRYDQDLEARREAFRAQPRRPLTMGDVCFPADPQAAAALLDGFFDAPGGPGRLPAAGGEAAVRGVIAPHIDYERGAALYAQAYLKLAEGAADAELFVILGTDHKGEVDAPFSLTDLDFETPFGRLRTDGALVRELCDADPGLRDGELAHGPEHSLEFQVVLLHHVLGPGAEQARILPVLCGGLTDREGRETAERRERVEAFINALGLLARQRRVCFVAGADLAHLGPAFGTPRLTAASHSALEQADESTLDTLRSGDPEAFRRDISRDGNARNVCGLATIYTLLRVLDGASGEVLGYRQCPVPQDEEGGSRVSITAVSYS
ncbi:MAG: AmmeMemoRadiSam system protein B [bacterium]